ncbi:hypothetical protein INT43_008771 [Umbelopsis isabellina]|uniref:Threonyl/alanyl tRNA synthetase SAD domain-containing protein n=1 Tax=Mortierella isabellina TaxID=91625 RepID=A0A8H7PXC6_MORIS|nr:hypothetical protein INT43_008771 [Umbelopsis isabellina]
MSPVQAPDQVPVGALACQKDTFLKSFTTQCIGCSEKPDKKGFYEVLLFDTVLFPEGGGQPFDTGYIDDVQVYNVQRRGLQHVHFTKQPIAVNKQVTLTVDWDRRFDHVQQHTGQHLLSAVLEQEPYKFETVGWNLGEKLCYVELKPNEGKLPTEEQLQTAEQKINTMIAAGSPIITHAECNAADENRPDSLPSDYRGGVIRTIEIPGLDKNPCCGTHAKDLAQLQSIKFLHTEKIRSNNLRLFFVVGRRVLDLLDSSYKTCKTLTGLLSCGPEDFALQVTRLQNLQRAQAKTIKRLMAELASHAVTELTEQINKSGYAMVHREDADMDYLSLLGSLAKEQKLLEENDKAVIVLAGGEQSAGGPIIVLGANDEKVKKTAQTLTQHLDGLKGGGKGRWQGKCKTWKGWENAKDAVAALYTA